MFLRLLPQIFLSFALFVSSPVLAQGISEAIKLDKQGFSLWSEGKFQEAVPLFKRSLALCEKALGPQHPDTADSLNNLGSAYKNIGDYDKALPLYERALAIWEKSIGPKHPFTADILNDLGFFYDSIGNQDKALQLYERALAIRQQSSGPEHIKQHNYITIWDLHIII